MAATWTGVLRAPVLLLDSREKWRPVAVDAIYDVNAAVRRPDGGIAGLFLDRLPADGGAIDFPRDMRQPADARPVGYWRRKYAGNLWWDQFWTFWLYNPKRYGDIDGHGGVGNHEGDWEFVQVGHAAEDRSRPVLVTCSQHHAGESRRWWRCTLHDDRPLIYVARDSHAGYFSPVRDVTDVADGGGMLLADIEWRLFGPWATWPGRWGNSRGEGKSPESPGCQGQRWNAPHAFDASARGA